MDLTQSSSIARIDYGSGSTFLIITNLTCVNITVIHANSLIINKPLQPLSHISGINPYHQTQLVNASSMNL